jgi:hypothetical protein
MVPLLGGVTNVRRARERPQPAGEEATADFPADDPLGRGGGDQAGPRRPGGSTSLYLCLINMLLPSTATRSMFDRLAPFSLRVTNKNSA